MASPQYYVAMRKEGSHHYVGDWVEYFWLVEEDTARRVNVISSADPINRREGLTMIETLRALWPEHVEFHPLPLGPGEYYPRMARPDSTDRGFCPSPGRTPDGSEESRHSQARSTGQLHAFIEALDQICRVVHPAGDNLNTYGHEIRNLLILACTDVELHWRNILIANGYKRKSGDTRFTTKNYVLLLKPMKLDQYVVNLNYYPWMQEIAPFACWSQDQESKSLHWYAAYNQVKHDREGQFKEATLRRAICAVTACFVMICAQYGLDFIAQGDAAERAFFRLTNGAGRYLRWPGAMHNGIAVLVNDKDGRYLRWRGARPTLGSSGSLPPFGDMRVSRGGRRCKRRGRRSL